MTARYRVWLEDWTAHPPVVVEEVVLDVPEHHDVHHHGWDAEVMPCPHPEHDVVRRLQACARELGLGADGLVFSRRYADAPESG